MYDVGPVARPAYMQTGVYARSIDEYAAAGDDSVSSVVPNGRDFRKHRNLPPTSRVKRKCTNSAGSSGSGHRKQKRRHRKRSGRHRKRSGRACMCRMGQILEAATEEQSKGD